MDPSYRPFTEPNLWAIVNEYLGLCQQLHITHPSLAEALGSREANYNEVLAYVVKYFNSRSTISVTVISQTIAWLLEKHRDFLKQIEIVSEQQYLKPIRKASQIALCEINDKGIIKTNAFMLYCAMVLKNEPTIQELRLKLCVNTDYPISACVVAIIKDRFEDFRCLVKHFPVITETRDPVEKITIVLGNQSTLYNILYVVAYYASDVRFLEYLLERYLRLFPQKINVDEFTFEQALTIMKAPPDTIITLCEEEKTTVQKAENSSVITNNLNEYLLYQLSACVYRQTSRDPSLALWLLERKLIMPFSTFAAIMPNFQESFIRLLITRTHYSLKRFLTTVRYLVACSRDAINLICTSARRGPKSELEDTIRCTVFSQATFDEANEIESYFSEHIELYKAGDSLNIITLFSNVNDSSDRIFERYLDCADPAELQEIFTYVVRNVFVTRTTLVNLRKVEMIRVKLNMPVIHYEINPEKLVLDHYCFDIKYLQNTIEVVRENFDGNTLELYVISVFKKIMFEYYIVENHIKRHHYLYSLLEWFTREFPTILANYYNNVRNINIMYPYQIILLYRLEIISYDNLLDLVCLHFHGNIDTVRDLMDYCININTLVNLIYETPDLIIQEENYKIVEDEKSSTALMTRLIVTNKLPNPIKSRYAIDLVFSYKYDYSTLVQHVKLQCHKGPIIFRHWRENFNSELPKSVYDELTTIICGIPADNLRRKYEDWLTSFTILE